MKIEKLLEDLDKLYPFEDAQKWDNVGLMVGSKKTKVDPEKMYVSLDVTSEVISQLPKNSVLVVHHPLIFKSLNKIDYEGYEGGLLLQMIKKDICCIVLHTNYDYHYLNRYFVKDILKKKITDQTEQFVYYEENIVLNDKFTNHLKNALGVTKLQVVDAKNKIERVAVCTGSGMGGLEEAIANGADLVLTGDVTYHHALKAKEMGVTVIDITHFNSEKYFGDDLVKTKGFKKINQQDPYTLL